MLEDGGYYGRRVVILEQLRLHLYYAYTSLCFYEVDDRLQLAAGMGGGTADHGYTDSAFLPKFLIIYFSHCRVEFVP